MGKPFVDRGGEKGIEPGRQDLQRPDRGAVIDLLHLFFTGCAGGRDIAFPGNTVFNDILPVRFPVDTVTFDLLESPDEFFYLILL